MTTETQYEWVREACLTWKGHGPAEFRFLYSPACQRNRFISTCVSSLNATPSASKSSR